MQITKRNRVKLLRRGTGIYPLNGSSASMLWKIGSTQSSSCVCPDAGRMIAPLAQLILPWNESALRQPARMPQQHGRWMRRLSADAAPRDPGIAAQTMRELTPFMRQWTAAKRENPDALLFFRMGDFYELFYDDAVVASRELQLTLTARDRERSSPCAAFPTTPSSST